MNKQRMFSNMKKLRKTPTKMTMICTKKILRPEDKAKVLRDYIIKIEKGNGGSGYSIKNIIESYYERKVIGINS